MAREHEAAASPASGLDSSKDLPQDSGPSEAEPDDDVGIEELQRQLEAKRAEAAAIEKQIEAAKQSSALESSHRPLSIVIPMGGLGDAFAEAGFRFPRPLVNIVGRPMLMWLLDHLSIRPHDVVILVVPAIVDKQFGISKMFSTHFPAHNMRVVTLPFETRGWVETLFTVVRQMSAQELRRPLVTLDCSTIYHGADLLARCRALPAGTGASVYFEAEPEQLAATGSVASQFSYLELDAQERVTGIREKAVISTHANTGGYIFPSGRHFRAAAERLLEAPERLAQTGLYASALISAMLELQERFVGLRVRWDEFAICATPHQLEAFIRRVSSGTVRMARSMRFCFDLDGTLVTEPRVAGDLASCEPIPNAIELVRQLHDAGHVIIITTSRGMSGRTVDTAIASCGHATFALLQELRIPYDELHFGKPHADVYVDSRSLNALADIERDLGWHVGPSKVVSQFEAIDGAIDARSFNLVRGAGKEHVIKSSKPEILRGECHWYRSIPLALADLFPEPVEITDGAVAVDGSSLSTIKMARVAGVTFSHLVTARLLTKAGVRRLVGALHRIHSQGPPAGTPAASETRATNTELCYNYANKVASRARKHQALYASLCGELGLDAQKMTSCVLSFLEEFEAGERAQHAFYIHGDPVFSNVIRTHDDRVVLIDMRGELGGRLTTQGDVHYDLSKVYQSLCGYDFMLLDQAPDSATSEVFDALRAAFWEEVQRLYPDVSHRDVRLHTAAHLFAIVPLHEVRSRNLRYLRASHSMLLVEGLL